MIKVLFITNELLITCGISKHLLYFLNEMKDQKEYEFSILCGGGDAVDVYRKICKEVIVDPRVKHENRSYLNYFVLLFNLIGLIKRNNYDIIHSHTHYSANISSKACKFFKTKNIQTNHGLLPDIGKLNHFAGEFIVCVNEHIKEHLIRNKIKPENKIKMIYNGVKEVKFSEEKINKKIRVIAASRFVLEKGLDTYIKAVAEVKNSLKIEAEFLIAGKGSEEKNLRILNEKLNSGVNFIGEFKDLNEILKTTHVFVFPTLVDEGLPVTLIEAALTKNLILCSNFGSMNTIFASELKLLIFEKENYVELANRLKIAIENYYEYQGVIDSLYVKVKKKFNIQRMSSQITGLYREVVK